MPQILSLEEFLALLNRSLLLTAEQFASVSRQVRARQAEQTAANPDRLTPDSITAEMVRKQILTDWQREQLLRGQSGFVLQHYRLLEPVGKGGMGHVFKARDDRSKAIVAVKVMARRLTNDQTLVNRFRREIRASLRLNNPHIVRTLDAGLTGNVDFMVMEFVNGEQLDRLARRLGVLPVGLSCEIIRQAALGLQHAFENQMVHRDVKPANLIVHWSADGRGTVKLMDLGLVRLQSEDDQQKTVTRAGQVMGTPDYMSPEQGWDTASVDIRADIYSLGCTLFRLLTGRIPFVGDNPLQVLMARCYKDAPPPRSVRSEIPEAVDAIVRRMTCRDPDSRFQTPQEVVDALAPFCVPLQRESLRRLFSETAASMEDDVQPLKAELSSVDPVLNSDTGYQQFLRDVESDADVELQAADSATATSVTWTDVETVLPMISQQSSADRKFRPKTGKQRGATSAWIAAGGACAMLIAVVRAAWPLMTSAPTEVTMNLDPTNQRPSDDDGTDLTSSIPQEASTSAAADNPATNSHSDLPTAHAASPTAAESVPQINSKWKLRELAPLLVQTGNVLEASVASPDLMPETAIFRYRFAGGKLSGMQLDQQTGRLLWTPTAQQLGSHLIDIELYDEQREVTLAHQSYRIVVEPQWLTFAWPKTSLQTAFAGRVFSVRVPVVLSDEARNSIRMHVGDASPENVDFDPNTQTVRWEIPETVRGRQLITLVAELISDHLRFSPDSIPHATLIIDVQPPPPALLVPPAELISQAEQELRNLFRRELNLARTPAARTALAARFLERSLDQTADPADFALLNVAGELAEKSRAFDLLLEMEHLKSQRYGTDELEAALKILADIRRPNLSALQSDLILEHTLRLAAVAVSLQHWTDVSTLLNAVEQVARGQQSVSPMLQDDVAKARAIADDLVRAGRESLDLAGVGEIKIRELSRLIQQWQFTPLFDLPEGLMFLQSSNTAPPLPDAGRTLWKLSENRLTFEAGSQTGLAGFVDTSREPGRCVIRLQLKPGTNSVNLIFGAGREADLRAFLLTLDASAPGRIQKLPGGSMIFESAVSGNPAALDSSAKELSLHAEIVIDGTTVSTKLNGVTIGQSVIRDLMPGRLGLMVPLQRPDGGPKLDIRRSRILILPDGDR